MKDTGNKTKKGFMIFDIIFITVIIILVALVLAKMLAVDFPGLSRNQSVGESLGNPRISPVTDGSHSSEGTSIMGRNQFVSESLGSPRASQTSGGSHGMGR